MNTSLILTATAAVLVIANLATHYPKITGNRASLRPRREQALMLVALVLAAMGLSLGPGILGYVLGPLAIIPACLFIFATLKSGLAYQQPAVAAGDTAVDFNATDADGQPFQLSALRG